MNERHMYLLRELTDCSKLEMEEQDAIKAILNEHTRLSKLELEYVKTIEKYLNESIKKEFIVQDTTTEELTKDE